MILSPAFCQSVLTLRGAIFPVQRLLPLFLETDTCQYFQANTSGPLGGYSYCSRHNKSLPHRTPFHKSRSSRALGRRGRGGGGVGGGMTLLNDGQLTFYFCESRKWFPPRRVLAPRPAAPPLPSPLLPRPARSRSRCALGHYCPARHRDAPRRWERLILYTACSGNVKRRETIGQQPATALHTTVAATDTSPMHRAVRTWFGL